MPFQTPLDDELAPQGEEHPAPAEGAPQDEFGAFLDGVTEEGGQFDPNTIVKFLSTAGGSQDIPVEGPTTISELLALGGIAVGANVQFWVNNAQVQPDFVVAPGATVTAVGLVKGGA